MSESDKKIETENEIIVNINPENLGAFIGSRGSNFKRMIVEMKKKIIGKEKEISSEEWNSVVIGLKFEKDEKLGKVKVIVKCEDSHLEFIKEVLNKYEKKHSKDLEDLKNNIKEDKKLVYRVGLSHSKIPKLIGIGGSNIANLKLNILKIEGIDKIKQIKIDKQTKRLSGGFRNIGNRDSFEHILITIHISGNPNFDNIQKVVEDYIKEE